MNVPYVPALLIGGADAMLASLAGSTEEMVRIAKRPIRDELRKTRVM